MAPKRKLVLPERPTSRKSSFVDCPACKTKVTGCLMNYHLDWDCVVLSHEAKVMPAAKEGMTTGAQDNPLLFNKGAHNFGAGWQLQKVCDPAHGVNDEEKEHSVCNHAESALSGSKVEAEVEDLENQERCSSSSGASTPGMRALNKEWGFIRAAPTLKAPKGHFVVESFISPEEEHQLVSMLDMDLKNPWKVSTFNGLHKSKAYGVVTDLKRRLVRPVIFDMPKAVQPILERMRAMVPALKEFCPNETNAIDYCKDKGHWLKPHVDDRQLSGTVLVNLSLCGECKMTYERERGVRESYKVLLRSRSIQILTGECRYNFTHSIQNQDLLAPRRISMTFRQSVCTFNV